MELPILKSLLNKEFYTEYRGATIPSKLFSKDNAKIKTMIDEAMRKYNRDLTVDEIEGLFFASDPSMTTAQEHQYQMTFSKMRKEIDVGQDVAQDILSSLYRHYLGEEIANIGWQYVNGTNDSLEPLRHMLDNYRDDFIPDISVEWDDISIENILAKDDEEAKWVFNLPPLADRVAGVNAGHLIIGGARPNTGKTSFHASLIAGPNGFAEQGAKCIILCNEEATHRVARRYLTAASGMHIAEVRKNPRMAQQRYARVRDNIVIKDVTGKDMHWVEAVCKTYKPDIVVLDMGDKFAGSGFTTQHEALKACAIHARQIAKEYGCALFYMSQLSADAENKIVLDQSMMEGSKTGKASEADLMLLISKNRPVEGEEEQDYERHINIAKNKLTGWHGILTCQLNYHIGRYEA
jgi:hypothetical protein